MPTHSIGRMWGQPPPNPSPKGATTQLPTDIDALDIKLGVMRGQSLAMSDASGPNPGGGLTWMRPRVIPLVPNGQNPTVLLSVDVTLVTHSRPKTHVLDLVLEGDCGTQGTIRLMFPANGWLLHSVASAPPAASPPCADPDPVKESPAKPIPPPEMMPTPDDAERSVRKKQDDILRGIFS